MIDPIDSQFEARFELEDYCKSLESKLEKAEAERDVDREQYEATLALKDAMIAGLKAKLEKAEVCRDEAKQTLCAVEHDLKDKIELDKIRMHQMWQEIDDLKQRLLLNKIYGPDESNEADELKVKVHKLEAELIRISDALDDKTYECEELKTENDRLNKDVQDYFLKAQQQGGGCE